MLQVETSLQITGSPLKQLVTDELQHQAQVAHMPGSDAHGLLCLLVLLSVQVLHGYTAFILLPAYGNEGSGALLPATPA